MKTKEEILNKLGVLEAKFKKGCEQIEQLQKELENLNKRWKLVIHEGYCCINSSGLILFTIWVESNSDLYRYKTRNCFKTEKEAKEDLDRILFVNDVRDFIEEENEGIELDWDNPNQSKYRISYSYHVKNFNITENYCNKETSDEKYFLNESTYKKIISKFDNQKLIKWWI